MVLHVEQYQAAVPKGIYGAQDKSCHKGGEEGAPQRLEWEVVAHLKMRGWLSQRQTLFSHLFCVISVETRRTSSRLKRTPPIGAPKATETPAADAAERTWEETKVGHKTNLRTKKKPLQLLCYEISSCLPPLVSWLHFCCI